MIPAFKKLDSEKKLKVVPMERPTLVILNGKLKGEVFLLKEERIVIGRGDGCTIRLIDQKSSREHAEIVRQDQEWILTDLKSQNGVFLNKEKCIQKKLNRGDTILIGETFLKFVEEHESKMKSELMAEIEQLKNYKSNSIMGSGLDDSPVHEPDKSKNIKKKTNKPLLLALLLLVALVLILPDKLDKKVSKDASKDRPLDQRFNEVNAELLKKISKQQRLQDKELGKNVDIILKRGLRELREKNYYRALLEFTHALDLNPNDAQSAFYLRKTHDELDQVIRDFNISAMRDMESLHYQRAVVSYCAIIRLLYNFQGDPRIQETKLKIEKLEEILGKEKGEIRCN